MASKHIKHITNPSDLSWVMEHYESDVNPNPKLKEKLLKSLAESIGKQNTTAVVALRDFIAKDFTLVAMLAENYRTSSEPLVKKMALHEFLIKPDDATKPIVINLIQMFKMDPDLSQPIMYVETSGIYQPALKYLEEMNPSAPTNATMLLSGAPQTSPSDAMSFSPSGEDLYGAGFVPTYGAGLYGAAGPVPVPVSAQVVAPVPVIVNPFPANVEIIQPWGPSVPRLVIWCDDTPSNNKPIVDAVLKVRPPIRVVILSSTDQIMNFMQVNMAALATYPQDGSACRIITDRSRAFDPLRRTGAAIPQMSCYPPNTILSYLRDEMHLNFPILVYCWRVDLAASLHRPADKCWVSKKGTAAGAFAKFQMSGWEA